MARRTILMFALALGGCASVSRIERSAERHEARANQLAAAGDTAGASKERASAEKQFSKANSRRGFEDVMPVVFK